MGLKVLHLGQITDFSGEKYEPQNYGRMRLNIRTGPGNTGIKKYGLGTSVSNTSDARLRLRVSGSKYYIGTSESSTRQSNYTSYSSYYTYTYTQTYPRSSVLTRQGTQTTATRTQPARYTYRATYYDGVSSGYTVSTFTNSYTQPAYLSGTRVSSYTPSRTASRSSGYTSNYSLMWTRSAISASITWQAPQNALWFYAGSSTSYYTTLQSTANVTAVSRGIYSYSVANGQKSTYHGSSVFIDNSKSCRYRYSKTTSKTTSSHYLESKKYRYTCTYGVATALTATRSSQYDSYYATTRQSNFTVVAPSYVALGAMNGPLGYQSRSYTVSNYDLYTGIVPYGSQSRTSYDGVVAGQSYRRISLGTYGNTYSSSTKRTGAATLTSTNTPIGGVPSNYTLYSGYFTISSQASYTYTDAGCTRTYASNYSTQYWTETQTLNSSPYYRSSLGSTAMTRVSSYTEHNFV